MTAELRDMRRERACATILENESLTQGLDDRCADILLDWILPDVERIADSMDEIDDEESARAAIDLNLRTVRKFMRLVSCGLGGQGADGDHGEDSPEGEWEAELYAPEDLSGGLVHDVAGLCAALRAAMKARESGR